MVYYLSRNYYSRAIWLSDKDISIKLKINYGLKRYQIVFNIGNNWKVLQPIHFYLYFNVYH